MARETAIRSSRTAASAALRLGERLRQLRVAAGLTQSELAGDRFSKEYVSQIERGKTRPTGETVEWLASRLGCDAGFLANGVATDERGRLEAALARAETMIEAHRNDDAAAEYEKLVPASRATGIPEIEVRALLGAGRTQMRTGALRTALDLLNDARGIVESANFSDLERAEVYFALGVCRYQLNSVQTALGLLNESLALAERSGMPSDSLRSNVLSWRSRCWRRQRDYEAAREDIERALQLAEDAADPRTIGDAYFQASMVADREGHWILARNYAEKARAAYEELSDLVHVGQLKNNLGGFNFMLGKTDEAIGLLKEAFGIALDTGTRGRRGAGRLVARADPPAHRGRRAGGGAGAACAPAARRPRGLPRRDRQRAARARPRAPRAGPARRRGGSVRRRRVQLRPARLGQPSRRPHGSRAATSPPGAATTGLQLTSTAPRRRHSRMFGSSGGGR